MTKPARPTFIVSRGEANSTAESIKTEDIEAHYRDIMRGAWTVTGLPEDCPEGFLFDALWDNPGVGIKNVRGYGPAVLPATAVIYDIYGIPVKWLPQPYGWSTVPDGSDFYTETNEPVLWIRQSLHERCMPYFQLMAKALKVLGQNITALAHPVLLSGGKGIMSADQLIISDAVTAGETMIPTAEKGSVPWEALDLGVTDNSQNLISTVMWCDSRILEMLGLSPGVEKTSGITAEETASGQAPMIGLNTWLEKVMKQWGGKVGVTIERNGKMEAEHENSDISQGLGMESGDSDSKSDGVA